MCSAGAPASNDTAPQADIAGLDPSRLKPEKVSDSTQYKPIAIAPKRGIGWNKGTKVLIIDGTDGNTWVVKGFELRLNPQQTHSQLIMSRK